MSFLARRAISTLLFLARATLHERPPWGTRASLGGNEHAWVAEDLAAYNHRSGGRGRVASTAAVYASSSSNVAPISSQVRLSGTPEPPRFGTGGDERSLRGKSLVTFNRL